MVAGIISGGMRESIGRCPSHDAVAVTILRAGDDMGDVLVDGGCAAIAAAS